MPTEIWNCELATLRLLESFSSFFLSFTHLVTLLFTRESVSDDSTRRNSTQLNSSSSLYVSQKSILFYYVVSSIQYPAWAKSLSLLKFPFPSPCLFPLGSSSMRAFPFLCSCTLCHVPRSVYCVVCALCTQCLTLYYCAAFAFNSSTWVVLFSSSSSSSQLSALSFLLHPLEFMYCWWCRHTYSYVKVCITRRSSEMNQLEARAWTWVWTGIWIWTWAQNYEGVEK